MWKCTFILFSCQVEKLNDERNWRKGLRVRTVLRRSVRTLLLQTSTDLQANAA
jgi:La-related protein 7